MGYFFAFSLSGHCPLRANFEPEGFGVEWPSDPIAVTGGLFYERREIAGSRHSKSMENWLFLSEGVASLPNYRAVSIGAACGPSDFCV
jgi:hypothetical protein